MFVDSEGALEACCKAASGHSFCAMDVEFIRRNTYEPIVALIQLGVANKEASLIDTLALPNPLPLRELLSNDGCLKVFHSCSQDIEALDVYCQTAPSNCFDTQIAGAFCGMGYQISFATLVEACLGVAMSKKQQTSDWLRRPLSEAQLAYAARDVVYLLEAYHVVAERLEANGRTQWVKDECREFLTDFREQQQAQRINPTRIRGFGRLNAREFTLLSHLLVWREDLAKRRNRPSKWMLSNAAMLHICNAKPQSQKQLAKIDKLTPKQVKHYGDDLLECIDAVMALNPEELERPPRSVPPTQKQKDLTQALTKRIDEIAQETEIAHEMLATHRDVSRLVRKREYDKSPLLKGWRKEVIGAEVMALLEPSS